MFIALSFKSINAFVDAVFRLLRFCGENQTYQHSQMTCLVLRFFLQICRLLIASALPNLMRKEAPS